MANWYVSSVAYTAVAQFAISHAYSIGDIIRQLAAPSVGNERCFRCTTAGTSGGTESAWNLTKGATTTQGTAVFTEVTGNETWQGTSWAAPHARLGNPGTSWPAAGDTIYVSADHAETQGSSNSITFQGSATSPCKILCVTRPSASIPPASTDLTTGGSITTTGAFAISLSGLPGNYYVYGLTFSAGTGSSAAQLNINNQTSQGAIFEQCTFKAVTTATTSAINIGQDSSGGQGCFAKFKNCNFSFANASQGLVVRVPMLWDGGALQGTAVTQLFGAFAGANEIGCDVRNVDLSLLAGSSSLVNVANSPNPRKSYSFTNCKLSASLLSVTTGTYAQTEDCRVDLNIADSGTNTSREEHYRYSGSIVADTANYLTAGATDGTTHKSLKFVSNGNCSFFNELAGPDIYLWLSAGSHTLTMYLANTSSVTLTDQQFGFEYEYMASASTPQGTLGYTFSNPAASGANLSTTSVAWTGLSSPTKQLATATITTALAGLVRVRPILRRASTTLWVDPLVAVS